MPRLTRILLFHEDSAASESLRSRLVSEGFDVATSRTFLEAAPHLMAGRTDLLLIQLPETEWVRNAILTEVRRAHPALPIVALTPAVSPELGQVLARLGVATVPPTGDGWTGLVETLHRALKASDPASGGQR
ncbi:MAG: hypothetical protein IT371_27505 [Deltaproteobacteria bacterium]|nr:hypothetical protein [Deltaproteobacteria bacterium]